MGRLSSLAVAALASDGGGGGQQGPQQQGAAQGQQGRRHQAGDPGGEAGVGLVCEPALVQEGGRLGPAAPPRPARLLVPVPTTSSPGLYLGLGVSSVGLIVFLVGLGRPPTLPADVTLQ